MLLFQEIHPVAIMMLVVIAVFVIKAVVSFVVKILQFLALLFVGYLLLLSLGDEKATRRSIVSGSRKVEATVVLDRDSTVKRNKPLFVPESSFLNSKGTTFIRLNNTYSIRFNANNQKNLIKKYPAIVEKRVVDNITTYFVIVGPFSSEGEAKEYLRQVQDSRFPFEGKIFSIKENSYS